ncbi:hypothetical protein F4553_002441 [Allocatelliglobosispora scoriae]|uniref:Vacuolar membrane protease n=1 Tax=Allocatelliglobosispora scoriae TaxID=643052 RepID=A0A841BQN5_9ACTN|nr:M20/M25/M40 family metallo-hydrolase [Allocatelliglobosispora scoriae]MBB5869062.1 hypothetical protein [Allocatelliglobosispora scoriae]
MPNSSRLIQPLIALACLAALAAGAIATVQSPSPRDAGAPPEDFSAGRAFAHVQQTGKVMHVAGSPANDEVRAYLLSTLQGMGIIAQVQDAIGMETEGDGPVAAARVRNVVGLIPGSASTGRVILMAHYDSVQNGPGANDDSAGLATILESVRALRTGPQPRNDIVLLFTDAEEACLCGAEAFVHSHELARDGGIVLNAEARGSSGPAVMFETSTGNSGVVAMFGKHAPHPVGTSVAVEVYRILPNDTDFTPFRLSGRFAGLNSAYIDGQAAYHKPQDTADRMDQGSLQHHGDNMLALARAFGDADLAELKKTGGADASYFPVLGLLVRYPGWLVWPLAILALLAVAALGVLTVRRGAATGRALAAGFGLALIPVIVAPIAAQLFWWLLTVVRPGYDNMIDPWRPVLYRWALAALVTAVVLGWFALARRRFAPITLAIGGLGWLAVFGVLMATAIPGGSYLAALPALCGALAGLAVAHRAGLIAAAAGAAVAVVILAPTVVLFFPALGLATGAAPALFAVLLGLALLPLFPKLPRVGRAAIGALVLFAGLAVTGLVVDRFDARHPVPSQLMYALDAGTGKAAWASLESTPGAWTSQFVTEQHDLTEDYPIIGDVWTGPAEAATLLPPEVRVVSDQREGTQRSLRLVVKSQRAVRLVYARIDTGGGKIVSAGVAGREIPAQRLGDGTVGVLFHAPPADGVELVVVVEGGTGVTVRAMDGSDGLADLPGFKPRPTGVDIAGSHSSELVVVAKTYPL